MHTPTSTQVKTVIDNFRKVLPLATKKDHLDMYEGRVNAENHKCGTVHCHAGWYTIAANDLLSPVDYEKGKLQMAIDLGFKRGEDLKEWAATHPEIWGNRRGESLFYAHMAFYSPVRPNGAESLQDIIDHWQEVHDRIKAVEDAQ